MSSEGLGRYRLYTCPRCGVELTDLGYNEDFNKYLKYCPLCGQYYYRIKGYGHKWKKGFPTI